MTQRSNCLECRYGVYKQKRVKVGKDRFDYVPIYHCTYDGITHSTNQRSCSAYVGHITIFEYLYFHQPQELHDLLAEFDLKVVGSNDRYGFRIVGE